jgi:hypothetical protein
MLVDFIGHKTAQEPGITRTSIYIKLTGRSPPDPSVKIQQIELWFPSDLSSIYRVIT